MLIVSGALAAVNGANIRVIVINMTSPEARGAAIAVLNFVNCLGRGTVCPELSLEVIYILAIVKYFLRLIH